MKRLLIPFIISLGILTSCKKNPVSRVVDPNPNGAVPQSSGIFIVYDDELKTGGGLGFIPGGENQFITLKDRSDPRRTVNAIAYSWNGGDVFNSDSSVNGFQHVFAGFSLTVTPDFTTFAGAPAKNLSAGQYNNMTLYVRGALSTGTKLRIEGPSDGDPLTVPNRVELDSSQLSSNWTQVTLPITASFLNEVKVFATFSFQYDQPPRTTEPGEGGIFYLDDIRYER